MVTEKGEPEVAENPEFTGGVNGVEPAIADPKGEVTAPTNSPSEAPASNVVPTQNNESSTGIVEKPEQPSEKPSKPVEAKTGHNGDSVLVSAFKGALVGGLIAAMVVLIRRARSKKKDDGEQ